MAETAAPDLAETSESARRCRLTCVTGDPFGAAAWQNAVPVIRAITVENRSDSDLTNVALSLDAVPAILRPLSLTIDRIGPGGLHRIDAPALSLDGAALADLRESAPCTLTLVARMAGEEIARTRAELRLLPANHWSGAEAAPELLAAFVRPDDPAVDGLLRAAAGHLVRAGLSGALDGYRGGTRARVWEMAQAFFAALADRGLIDIPPPESFAGAGQAVRAPGEIVAHGAATGLDLALLLAAGFERAGLNPLLVLTRGQAGVGLWLDDARLPGALGADAQALRKRRDLDELILIETTRLTQAPPARFADAVAAGARLIDEGAADAFVMALDLRRARAAGIRPLAMQATPLPGATAAAAPSRLAFAPPPVFAEGRPAGPTVRAEPPPRDRLEIWTRRLLDLTLRNRLLNFKPGKAAIALRVPDPDALAAQLAGGASLRLLARAEAGGDAGSIAQAGPDEILTGSDAEDLETRLTDLFRQARTGLEEGGANPLHLAFGFLAWSRGEGMAPVRAPLLLVPVSLTRTSVRAGFRLVRDEAEARLNPTLVEMLRQDFALAMPDLAAGLPGEGRDVAALWRSLRGHVRDLPGFEVVPEVTLATFAFTKILMWKDLAERTDLLKRNRLVRHLLDTPNLPYGDAQGFPAPERLDAEHPPHTVFTPLSADSSQLAAILAAAAGKDFVLFGPPAPARARPSPT